MINFKHLSILAIAAGVLGLPAHLSAQTSADAKAGASSVKQYIGTFSAQRQAMIKQRQELLQKLKAAKTAAERQQILKEAQKRNKELITAQQNQAKQIQSDIKEEISHDQHRGPPGGPGGPP